MIRAVGVRVRTAELLHIIHLQVDPVAEGGKRRSSDSGRAKLLLSRGFSSSSRLSRSFALPIAIARRRTCDY